MAYTIYLGYLPGFSGSTSTRVSRAHLDQALHFCDLHLYPPVSKSIMACMTYLRHLPGFPGPHLPGSAGATTIKPHISEIYTYTHQCPIIRVSGATSTMACPVHPTRALHFLDLQLLLSTSPGSSARQCPDLSWPARSTWDIYRVFRAYIYQGLPGPPHSCPTLPRSTATIVHLSWVLGPPVSRSIMACMTYLGYIPGFSGSTSTRVSRHLTQALRFRDLQLCPTVSKPTMVDRVYIY